MAKWTAKLAAGATAPASDEAVLVVEIPEDRDWMAEFPPERLPHAGVLSGAAAAVHLPLVNAPRVTAPASLLQPSSAASVRVPGQQEGSSLSINVTTFRRVHRSIVLTMTMMALTLSIGVVTIGLSTRGPAAPPVTVSSTPPELDAPPAASPPPVSAVGETSALAFPPASTETPPRTSATPARQPRDTIASAAAGTSADAVVAATKPRESDFAPPPLPTGAGLPELKGVVMPAAPAAMPVSSSNASETSAILSVLDRYRRAFSSLNAQSVRAVWPGANLRALTREFSDLKRQTLAFDHCRVDVQGSRAEAICGGRASVVPKSATTANIESRRWVFTLVNDKDAWRIATVETQ